MAERAGFEPAALIESLVFKTSSINRSDTSPYTLIAADRLERILSYHAFFKKSIVF